MSVDMILSRSVNIPTKIKRDLKMRDITRNKWVVGRCALCLAFKKMTVIIWKGGTCFTQGKVGWGLGLFLACLIIPFSLPFSGKHPDITEIRLTGT